MEQKPWYKKTTLWAALAASALAVVGVVQGLVGKDSAWASILPLIAYILKEAVEKLALGNAAAAKSLSEAGQQNPPQSPPSE